MQAAEGHRELKLDLDQRAIAHPCIKLSSLTRVSTMASA